MATHGGERPAQWLWGLAGVVVGALALPLDPNLLEEGIVVHIAERMADGEALFRDIVIHTGLLPFELLAALFRVFGADIGLARLLLLPLQALACMSVYTLVASAGPRAPAHAAAAAVAAAPILLFPFFSIFFYTTLAFYLSLITAYAASRAVASSHWASATGLLIAAVALSKQSNGVILALTLIPATVFLSPSDRRLAVATRIMAGGLLALFSTIALYAVRGDLGPLWFAQVELPLAVAGVDAFTAPFLNLWPPGEMRADIRENWVMYLPPFYFLRHGLFTEIGSGIVLATQVLFALPFVAALVTAARVMRGHAPRQLWLLGAVLVAMTSNIWPRADWAHLAVALPPAVVQLALCLPTLPGRGGTRLRSTLAVATVAAIAASVAFTANWLWTLSGPATLGPRIPFRTVSRVYRNPTVPRVIHYLRARTQPGDPIFVARCEPLIYHATETRNPTPFEGIFPGMPAMQEGLILEALTDLRYVVMSDVDQPFYTYYADELPRVQEALERHFAVPADFPIDDYSWLVVLERGPDRGESLIDLRQEMPRARAWVRGVGGLQTHNGGVPEPLAARQNHRPLPFWVGTRGGGLDFPLIVPERAEFRAGVGLHRILGLGAEYEHPRGLTLALELDAGDGFETLAEVRIDGGVQANRRWTPFEVDLGDYAGREVVLRLAARAERPLPQGALTWWGSPRIVRRPG